MVTMHTMYLTLYFSHGVFSFGEGVLVILKINSACFP
jgi:hypothetical protein